MAQLAVSQVIDSHNLTDSGLAVVRRGLNGAGIARELKISEATVRHHITSILSKLEVSNKLELAVYAFHHGLGQTPDEPTS